MKKGWKLKPEHMYLGCEIKRVGVGFLYSEVSYFSLGALLRMENEAQGGSVQCILIVTSLTLWKV